MTNRDRETPDSRSSRSARPIGLIVDTRASRRRSLPLRPQSPTGSTTTSGTGTADLLSARANSTPFANSFPTSQPGTERDQRPAPNPTRARPVLEPPAQAPARRLLRDIASTWNVDASKGLALLAFGSDSRSALRDEHGGHAPASASSLDGALSSARRAEQALGDRCGDRPDRRHQRTAL